MISRKFAYADDLPLLHSSRNWKDLEETLSQDMSTLSAYLQIWRLKLSHTKIVTAAFHLNNREAKRELKVYNINRLLRFCPTPTYLGVKLDRSLMFHHYLVALHKKLSSRVILLRWLVSLGWDAGAKTLRIAALFLVYSTTEYWAPIWYHSAHTHKQYLEPRLAHSHWISGPWSYFEWSFKWVLRCSPRETKRLHVFVPRTGARPVGMGLSQSAWVKLNCLRTGVGHFWVIPFIHAQMRSRSFTQLQVRYGTTE